MAFYGPHGLGDAVAPHGSRYGFVGKYGIGIHLHIFAGVKLGKCPGSLCHDAVAVGGVCPLIREGFQLPGRIRSVRANPGDNVAADGVAHPVCDEGVFPGNIQLDQVSAQLHT